jgi:hypothetical protein
VSNPYFVAVQVDSHEKTITLMKIDNFVTGSHFHEGVINYSHENVDFMAVCRALS